MVHLLYLCFAEQIHVFLGLGYGTLAVADSKQEEDEFGNADSKRIFKFERDPSPD
jgi:hypothetical protein